MKRPHLIAPLFCATLGLSPLPGHAATAASAKTGAVASKWPFIVIRHQGAVYNVNGMFESLVECHRRFPLACDEFWFCTPGYKTIPELERSCENIVRYRKACEELGILFSFQQGVTLGHAEMPAQPSPGAQAFPDDAWQVGRDGRTFRIPCPRSPFVLDYEKNFAKTIMRICNPASYWLDDDLRLGTAKPEGCYCDRCIAAFNEKTGDEWTRETLVKKLYDRGVAHEPLRRQWSDFNAESLALFAGAVRKAADELGSPCRLGYQSIRADCLYTASDYGPVLRALSGPRNQGAGIRPGDGFYTESEPRGMVVKCLSVAREAERCRSLKPHSGDLSGEAALNGPQGRLNADGGNVVASICYEQETYTRKLLHKSPGAIMTECALALASGCDSLSLYWFPAENPLPVEEYDRFLSTLLRARPYFERLAASTRRTRLGGLARFVGSAAGETLTFDLRDATDVALACAGIPVTVANPAVSAWYLTGKSNSEKTPEDIKALASMPVVDVQGVDQYPLVARRTKLLDDLDAVTGGTFPVRVDACRPLRILPRVRDDGRLDSVTLLNLSIGRTDEIKVRVRRPVSRTALLQNADMHEPEPVATAPGKTPDELVVTLQDIGPWQIVTLFF